MLNPFRRRTGRHSGAAHPGRRPRRTALTAIAVTGALFGLAVAGTVTAPTAAAWTNSANVKATANSGTWNTCQVRNANGTVDASKPCTVTIVKSTFWGTHGSGQATLDATVSSAAALTTTQYFTFSLTLTGAPAWWVWSASSGMTRTYSNIVLTTSCAQLPTYGGRTAANQGSTVQVGGDFMEVRGANTARCIA